MMNRKRWKYIEPGSRKYSSLSWITTDSSAAQFCFRGGRTLIATSGTGDESMGVIRDLQKRLTLSLKQAVSNDTLECDSVLNWIRRKGEELPQMGMITEGNMTGRFVVVGLLRT